MTTTSLRGIRGSTSPIFIVTAWRTWAIYLLGCGLLFALAMPITAPLASGQPDVARNSGHRVLGTYWASGDAANRGLNPYSVQPLTFQVHVPRLGVQLLDPNLNPPVVLPLFQALACFPIASAAHAWMTTSYLLFTLSGAILLALHPAMQKRQALWLMLSMPVLGTLTLGQIYALLLLLAVLMWAAVRSDNITAAALCLGVVISIRPLFLVWLVLLALRGDRRLAWQTVAVVGALALLPIAIYGPDIYLEWVHAMGHDQHYIFLTDISLPAFGRRFGYPAVGWALAAFTGAACAFVSARRRTINIHVLSIACACLCSPLAWTHYLLLSYPWLVEQRWNWRLGTAAALLTMPDFGFWVMRTAAGPNCLPMLGSAMATAVPILLIANVWVESRSSSSSVNYKVISYA